VWEKKIYEWHKVKYNWVYIQCKGRLTVTPALFTSFCGTQFTSIQ